MSRSNGRTVDIHAHVITPACLELAQGLMEPQYEPFSYWAGQETNMGQARQLGDWELTGGGWRNALTYTDRLARVSPADVRRVAQRYLTRARFVVIGDPKKVDRALFTSM